MENASKALIIAGAILLSILLISLGIMIFNQASDVTNNNGLDEATITTFNSKFTKYEGVKKGSEVRSLIQEINASNATEQNLNSQDRQVTISGAGISNDKTFSKDNQGKSFKAESALSNNKSYEVKITGYKKGLVNTITVTAK